MPVVDSVIAVYSFMHPGSTIKAVMALKAGPLGAELESERFNQTVKEYKRVGGGNICVTQVAFYFIATAPASARCYKPCMFKYPVSPMAPQQAVRRLPVLQLLDESHASQWAAIGAVVALGIWPAGRT